MAQALEFSTLEVYNSSRLQDTSVHWAGDHSERHILQQPRRLPLWIRRIATVQMQYVLQTNVWSVDAGGSYRLHRVVHCLFAVNVQSLPPQVHSATSDELCRDLFLPVRYVNERPWWDQQNCVFDTHWSDAFMILDVFFPEMAL